MSEATTPRAGGSNAPAPSDAPAPGAGEAVEADVEAFLARASARGETAVSLSRLVVCGLALARLLVVYGADLAAGAPKPWIGFVALLVGIAFSAASLRRARSTSPLRLRLSVLVDALVVTATLVPMVVWPHPTYMGATRELDLAAFIVVVVAAGARLSPHAAALGAVMNAAGLALLLGIERGLLPAERTSNGRDIALLAILYTGAATFAWAAAAGTRRLVREGADALERAATTRHHLGVYLSEEVARAVEAGEVTLGGRRQDVAIVFTDLRGFTRRAEGLDPDALVRELNAYLDAMVQAIRAEGGVVDKFIGDSVMAVFGAPLTKGDPAAAAIRAAERLERSLVDHNVARAADGRPPLAHGVGVHHGQAVVGNIGARERMQFTVVGDAVNVASRLESATKDTGVSCLVSDAAVASARRSGEPLPALRPFGRVELRGREAALETWTLGA